MTKRSIFIILMVILSTISILAYLSYTMLSNPSSSGTIKILAYRNDNVHTKINAITNKLQEFTTSEYQAILEDDQDLMFIRIDEDEWSGIHFIFDLSGYSISDLTSINFTWNGGVLLHPDGVEEQLYDCMEVWHYTDHGWAKVGDIDEGDWALNVQSYKWMTNISDYVDADGKVHISLVVHVKDFGKTIAHQPIIELITLFVKLEVT